MSINAAHILLILGMALVTCLPRALPLMLLSSRSLNPVIERWLRLIPPAVLAALLAPELLLDTGGETPGLFISYRNVMLMSAVPALLAAWLTRSFLGTVVAGMLCAALLRWLFNFL